MFIILKVQYQKNNFVLDSVMKRMYCNSTRIENCHWCRDVKRINRKCPKENKSLEISAWDRFTTVPHFLPSLISGLTALRSTSLIFIMQLFTLFTNRYKLYVTLIITAFTRDDLGFVLHLDQPVKICFLKSLISVKNLRYFYCDFML